VPAWGGLPRRHHCRHRRLSARRLLWPASHETRSAGLIVWVAGAGARTVFTNMYLQCDDPMRFVGRRRRSGTKRRAHHGSFRNLKLVCDDPGQLSILDGYERGEDAGRRWDLVAPVVVLIGGFIACRTKTARQSDPHIFRTRRRKHERAPTMKKISRARRTRAEKELCPLADNRGRRSNHHRADVPEVPQLAGRGRAWPVSIARKTLVRILTRRRVVAWFKAPIAMSERRRPTAPCASNVGERETNPPRRRCAPLREGRAAGYAPDAPCSFARGMRVRA